MRNNVRAEATALCPAVDQAHVHVVLGGRARRSVALLERPRRTAHRLAVRIDVGLLSV